MALSTKAGLDIKFVQRQIEKYGLDPVAEGSHSIKIDTVCLTVEQYGWGRVFHASDKSYNLSLTWVEQTDDKTPALPSWARKVRAFADRPSCLGHRASDHVCDGGKNSETGEMERACFWRARCMVVQSVAGNPANVPSVLEQFTDADLSRKVEESKPRRKKSAPNPSLARVKQKKSAATFADSRALVDQFITAVMEAGKWTLATTRFRASCGQFFIREYKKGQKDEYLVLFRRVVSDLPDPVPGAGRMPSIVMFLPHRSRVRFSMQIRSAQVEFISGVMPSNLSVRLGNYDKTHGKLVSVNRVTPDEFSECVTGMVQVIQERKYDAPGSFPAIGTNAPRAWTQHSVVKGNR